MDLETNALLDSAVMDVGMRPLLDAFAEQIFALSRRVHDLEAAAAIRNGAVGGITDPQDSEPAVITEEEGNAPR